MTCTGNKKRHLAGQTIIFFMMILVILVFVVLWNFDLHKILYVKSLTQNAGDAAAVMGSRWQGITLNLVGDLNIMHALAISMDDPETADAITNMQARLCFVGPMIAFAASQQAAKNNGIYSNDEFTQELRRHAAMVRNDYTEIVGPDGEMLFPEPYPDAWQEYADMLDAIASEGVAAGPDSVGYYGDFAGGHYLLMIDFYDAIAGRQWCWFYHNAPTLLEDYENFMPCWWDPLPDVPRREYANSEIFGLDLTRVTTALSGLTDYGTITDMADERGIDAPGTNAMDIAAPWYCYGGSWGAWEAMSVTGDDPFPLSGPVRPQYDYAGADVAVRIETVTGRLTPGPRGSVVSNAITWTAAAKPFGYLNEDDLPTLCSLVLPAFRESRLIPIDASSASAGGGYNLAWRRHIEDHLPEYMENGPSSSSCWYCRQLLTWENESFRESGVDWLAQYSYRCIVTSGGGGGGGDGGRRRGH